MKIIIILICLLNFTISFSQNEGNDESGVFLEKTYTEIGKILDFRASIVSVKNLKTQSSSKKLILESKSFTSSELKNFELDKNNLTELISNMKILKSNYFSLAIYPVSEVSYSSKLGHEIGGAYTLDKASTSVSTKKEKYYIETKEKYYEGKLVNTDGSGTFIWKEVAATKEQTGKWLPFIRLNNNSSKTTFNFSLEDFDNFIKFLEENSSKL